MSQLFYGKEGDASFRFSQLVVVGICTLVIVLDGMDMQILAFLAPTIMHEFEPSERFLGIAFAVGFLGSLAGRVLMGSVADRVGRRLIIASCIMMFGVTTFAIGFARSLSEIITLRFVAGIALGGVYPAVFALVYEWASPAWRALSITLVSIGTPLGGVLAGVLTGGIVDRAGWRGVFWVCGSMSLLLVVLVLRFVKDSLEYRETKALYVGMAKGKRNGVFDFSVIMKPSLIGGTLCVWLIYLLSQAVTGYLISWLPVIFGKMQIAGLSGTLALSVVNGAAIVGAIVLGALSRAIEEENVAFLTFGFGAVIFLVVSFFFILIGYKLWLLILFGVGVTTMGAVLIVNTITAGVYPTEARAAGIGWALAWSTIGLALGSWLGGEAQSAEIAVAEQFRVVSVALLLTSALVLRLSINTKSRIFKKVV